MVAGMHGKGESMHGKGACGGCMAEGACVTGECMAGGCVWWGHVWQGGVHARGRAWQGDVRGRYYVIRSMSGRYASYWNALLYKTIFRFA